MMFSFFSKRGNRRRRIPQSSNSRRRKQNRFWVESLEARQMLSVNLGTINSIDVPGGKSVLVPLTGIDSSGGPIHYSFSASDFNVQLSLVSPTSKSIALNVTGTDNTNTPFSGTLVLHLFEDFAPRPPRGSSNW